MAFQDFYRLSSHAVLTNDAGQVLLLKANYADQAWGAAWWSLGYGRNHSSGFIT